MRNYCKPALIDGPTEYFKGLTEISLPTIPAASPSKTWVCGRSLAGIVGSNPPGNMDVCLSAVCCQVEVLLRNDHWSRGVLPSVVRRCV